MPTSRNISNTRHTLLTTHRIVMLVGMLVLIAVGIANLIQTNALRDRSFMPTTTQQVTKVEQGSAYLRDIGFENPIYLGVTPATEGQYPTYRVTAIGGQSIDLWIRTQPNGGWEIQPVGYYGNPIASADEFARVAQQAVMTWKDMSTRTNVDTSSSEYTLAEYDNELLSKYVPSKDYWYTVVDETAGWPKK